MTRYNPWVDLAQRPHLTLVTELLPDDVDALYDPATLEVVVCSRLTQVERRSALAHELVHVDRGDEACQWPYSARSEQSCQREAARRLIDIDLLCQAFAVWGEGDLDSVAADCWVTLDMLLARLDGLHPTERGLVRRALDAREAAA